MSKISECHPSKQYQPTLSSYHKAWWTYNQGGLSVGWGGVEIKGITVLWSEKYEYIY